MPMFTRLLQVMELMKPWKDNTDLFSWKPLLFSRADATRQTAFITAIILISTFTPLGKPFTATVSRAG